MDETNVIAGLRQLLDRPADSYKYMYGHVLVIGGSSGMVGAPLMAARAALRTGAGLVTIASTIADVLQGRQAEIMTYQLGDYGEACAEQMIDFIGQHVSVLVIGPGLGNSAASFIQQICRSITIPIVLDAGALTAYSGHLADLRTATEHNEKLIITPHAGEFRNLNNNNAPDELTARQQIVQSFARDNHLTLLLKGSPTLVATFTQSTAYVNTTGNPGLATAGTGDVLSGVIAGLCAQGLEPFLAASSGAYLHGLAGDQAVASLTQPATIAGDVIDYLPAAFKQL